MIPDWAVRIGWGIWLIWVCYWLVKLGGVFIDYHRTSKRLDEIDRRIPTEEDWAWMRAEFERRRGDL